MRKMNTFALGLALAIFIVSGLGLNFVSRQKTNKIICHAGFQPYVYQDALYQFGFCYPDGWTVPQTQIAHVPAGYKPTVAVSFGRSTEPNDQIQMQTDINSFQSHRQLFLDRKANPAQKTKDKTKYLVLKDIPGEFLTYSYDLSTDGQFSGLTELVKANPFVDAQNMRIWFFYDESDSTDQVREESKVFTETVESFKWLKTGW